jgi:hypothetical protein
MEDHLSKSERSSVSPPVLFAKLSTNVYTISV